MNSTDNHDTSSEDVQNDEVIGKAMKYSALLLATIFLLVAVGLAVKQFLNEAETVEQLTELAAPELRTKEDVTLPMLPLVDVTQAAGITWKHSSGMQGEKLLPETMGGGVSVLDYNNDSLPDLLFVGGRDWEWDPPHDQEARPICLYRNDGEGKFTDVTESTGITQSVYGMAALVGDYDNDGWKDIYLTAVGKNVLLHNQNGQFEDVTENAQIAGEENAWSTGGTWFDYDRDGLLDLFVCNYVVWNRELDLSIGFSLTGIGRAYGQPTAFTGMHSRLYHNEGNGKFLDVSASMGIEIDNPNTGVPVGKGLAVVAADVNHDGWVDLMVANDTVQNFLFMNLEGKLFEEVGIPLGVALDRSGNATGAMGVDCSYLRNDDSLAIAVGNFANEPSSLFISRGPEPPFFDSAMSTGLGPMSRLNLTFGLFFADLDLDSRQDLVCSNGHLEAEIAKVQSTQQYAQSPQYFWNAGAAGSSEFVAWSVEQLGTAALERMIGRGSAYADLDSDGDLDIILVGNSSAPRVLRNDQASGHNWLRLELEGSGSSNRDALGAQVSLTAGGTTQRRTVTPTRSYLSQSETTLTFGLGKHTEVDSITITWPDGTSQNLPPLAINQFHHIKE